MKPLRACRRAWRLSSSSPLLVCLDFDGTLTAIARHPSVARVLPSLRKKLQDLAKLKRARVALISGRSLKDLKAICPVSRAWYSGNHGLEIEGPGVHFVHPQVHKSRRKLALAAQKLAQALRGIPGAWVENKRMSLSVHWRQTPPRLRRSCRVAALGALAGFRSLRITQGKCVLEVRPQVNWNKGKAVEWLKRRLTASPPARWLVIYAGDDQTDEDAFRAANRMDGISVKIGWPRGKTSAHYWLRNSAAVSRWVGTLADTREKPWQSKRRQHSIRSGIRLSRFSFTQA